LDSSEICRIEDVERLALSDPDEYHRLLRGYKTLNGQKDRQLIVRKLSSYTRQKVDWLWANRLPRGKVSIMAGDGGEGKTFCIAGISAALTAGNALPGGVRMHPKDVLVWHGEDGTEDTIYGRMEDAGAVIDRINIIGGVDEDGVVSPFTLVDMPLLYQKVEQNPEIALVAIDPISALLSGVDSFRDAEVRSALQPFAEFARQTGIATLLIMHLKKGEETTFLHKLSGSVAFGALARSVLMVGTHAESGRKSIDCVKHNLAPDKPEPVEFFLDKQLGFRWGGIAPDLTAQAIHQSKLKANKGIRAESAQAFLKEFLANGPLDSKLIWREAKDRGIADMTLRRAKEELGIKAQKEGYGDEGRWVWSLPGIKGIKMTAEQNALVDEYDSEIYV
jgi:hypothetical protein